MTLDSNHFNIYMPLVGLVTAWTTLGRGQPCVISAFVEIHLETQVVVKSTITHA